MGELRALDHPAIGSFTLGDRNGARYPSYEARDACEKPESVGSNFLNPINMICPVQPSPQK